MLAVGKRLMLFMLVNFLVFITMMTVVNLICYYFGISPDAYIPYLLVFSLVFGFGGAFVSLMISKFMAVRAMGVQIVDPETRDPELRWLVDRVYEYARSARLGKMPEVGIYESPEVNAFATGPSKNNSLVAVSTGLMRRMDRTAVAGVIGHEVAHIANGDMVTMTLLQGVINSMVIFFARLLANIIASQMRNNNDRGGGGMSYGLYILFEIVFSVLGMIVLSYFSRRREFRADSGGAKYAGQGSMIHALKALQSNVERVDDSQPALATLKISGRRSGLLMRLFSTHPPLEDRIKALQAGPEF